MEDNKETTESRLKQDNRTIYDYMKLVFNYFIIGLAIVACLFVYLLNKVPADKLIIDFSLGDGVISIIATLIGIMVTFAIGYQIYNAIQIKDDVDYIKKDVLAKVEYMEYDFKKLENKFKLDIAKVALESTFNSSEFVNMKVGETKSTQINSFVKLYYALDYFFANVQSIDNIECINELNKYISNKSFMIKGTIDFYINNHHEIEHLVSKNDRFNFCDVIELMKTSESKNKILLLYIISLSDAMNNKTVPQILNISI